MSTLETIVRPFVNDPTDPVAFQKPGATGVPSVRVVVGIKGGTKTFSFSGNSSRSTRIGHTHKEKAPVSQALQDNLAKASD